MGVRYSPEHVDATDIHERQYSSRLDVAGGASLLFFHAERARAAVRVPVDGTGAAEPLTDGSGLAQHALSISPDDRWLAFFVAHPENGSDIWVVPLPRSPSTTTESSDAQAEGERQPRPVLEGPFNERWAAFSPDGRWLAYASDETGRSEVYVQPFPVTGAKTRLSTEGGNTPVWARNGRELFYVNGTTMMVVGIATEGRLDVGSPERLFDADERLDSNNYDVSPDAERFIMVQSDPSSSTELRLVINWFEELKELVPTR